MKRLRVDEAASKEPSGHHHHQHQQQPLSANIYRQQPQHQQQPAPTLPANISVASPAISYAGSAVKPPSAVDAMQSAGLYAPSAPVGYGVVPGSNKPLPMRASPPQEQQQPQQQSPGNSFQRLKVEDALSYLDLVKYKFGSKPQVYNDFLDIMKEFKSQSIDTPGVIQRVSSLFKGFPDLIVGFNTFLPPGYKIEVQRNDQGYAFQVSVSMPSPTGGTVSSESGGGQPKSAMIFKGTGTINVSAQPAAPPSLPSVCQPLSLAQQPAQAPPPSQPVPSATTLHVASSGYGGGAPVHHNNAAAAAGAMTLSQAAMSHALQGQAEAQQGQPVEFNHAINYVNKIKVCYCSDHEQCPQILCNGVIEEEVVRFLQVETDMNVTASKKRNISGGRKMDAFKYNENSACSCWCVQSVVLTNKVKNRFQGQPEKYKRFLEILHTYQKEQRTLKETSQGAGGGGGAVKHLTEQEVYSQVAKLFENQSDLLAEFGQFLPDASNNVVAPPSNTLEHIQVKNMKPVKQPYRDHVMDRHVPHKPGHMPGQMKRSPPYPSLLHREAPPQKKHKLSSSCRDVTLAEAGKYGTLNDYAFFDKVRKAIRSQEVYNNLLRCLTLFNQEIISKTELIHLVAPFLGKFPELMRWFREFLGQTGSSTDPATTTAEPVSAINASRAADRPQGDRAFEVDLSTAKRLGASYCVIPPSQEGLRCSGRTALCREVLNDQWVSIPTWSEDSTFVSSRKTQYEEHMYRCEDERFELDVVIETNASTIRVLEGVQKKMNRMNPDDVARYRLDDCLGGSSPVLHQRALKRIYGDKAQDIVDGLKRNPVVAVPVVLRRLKAKEEEWREAQKGFNKLWREQNEKYYLKSLDHQGINFKQNDVKALRSKSLFNEIETLFDEQHEQNEEGGEPIVGPHLILPYKDRTILDDATNLLMHHLKRQTGVQKGEKRRIKQILCHFIPDLFFHPRQQLSDDEREDDDDDKEEGDVSPKSNSSGGDSCKGKSALKSPVRASEGETMDDNPEFADVKEEDVKVPLHAQCANPDEEYTLFMANNNWYIFLRLHAILCERLAKIYERTIALAKEEAEMRKTRKESTAVALRLKPRPQIEVENYYTAFLEIVKNLLDGNMEPNAYEDTLREMFGIHAYIAFTLDKVVQYAVRQLQHCVTERTAIACAKLFQKEQKRGAAGGPCATAHRRLHLETAYQRAAEKAVQDENCFKIFIYKRDCRMTIELLDTESEDSKKVDEAKKWSVYKECYADITNSDRKQRSPVYLGRNLRNNRRFGRKDKNVDQNHVEQKKAEIVEQGNKTNNGGRNESDRDTCMEELERKLDRPLPERNVTQHTGYDVSDETQCKFNSGDSKIMFTVNKDSYLYKHCAFSRAKQTHQEVTKRLSSKFRQWLKRWCAANVTDAQQKHCTDWLMGRCEGVVPNRTRVLTDNDLARTPYVPYNRYRVERLSTGE